MRALLLGVVIAIMFGLLALQPALEAEVGARAALVFGFLLLGGFLLGELLVPLGLPRITSYLVGGMAFGPSLLGIVDGQVISHLKLVDDLALCLIAFTAGGELRADRLRARLRTILSITAVQTTTVFLATTGALWGLLPLLPLGVELSPAQTFGIAAVLGVIATAKSPATTVAIIVETRAHGPMTDTVLGVTMLKDIVVLVVSTVLIAFVADLFAAEGGHPQAANVLWLLAEVGLSLLGGGVMGLLMIAYLRWVGREPVLFVLAAAFLIIGLSDAFHLHALLVAIAAGFAVSNLSRHGERFLRGLERAAAPVFLVFFCLAGAILDLEVLGRLWHVVLVYVALRLTFTWAGTAAGAALTRDLPVIRRYAWTGFLGQAGVSLGLATLVRQTAPGVGPAIADLIVGGIVVNQMLGPVLFKRALVRAGEGRPG